jgi:signal peptidase I
MGDKMANKRTLSFVMLAIFLASVTGSVSFYFTMPKSTERYQLLLIASQSMEPTIMKGSIVLVDKSVGADQIVAASYPDGDIICFHQSYGDELIIHRAIVKRVQNGDVTFITKGDHNSGPDQPIPSSALVGKVVNTNVPIVALTWALVSLVVVAIVTGVLCIVLYATRTKGRTDLSPTSSTIHTSAVGSQDRKFCRFCGAENKSEAVFCEKCGKRISDQ